MKRTMLGLGAMIACLAAPAGAQTDAMLPPVDTMNCEQMQGEMMVAGQQMQSQMDPNLAGNIQEMQAEGAQRMRSAQAGMVGAGVMCAIPGLGAACMAAQQAQIAEQMSHVDEDTQRRDSIVNSVQSSMAGIDQDRMMAISNRFESQHCPTPQ